MLKMISAIDTFAALADPIRLRCLALIAARQELCVCELVGALELPQPKVSRHLAICMPGCFVTGAMLYGSSTA